MNVDEERKAWDAYCKRLFADDIWELRYPRLFNVISGGIMIVCTALFIACMIIALGIWAEWWR